MSCAGSSVACEVTTPYNGGGAPYNGQSMLRETSLVNHYVCTIHTVITSKYKTTETYKPLYNE